MIIQSLLDTDLYKFTMMQVVFHHFKEATTRYAFKCRNAGVDLRPVATELAAEVQAMSKLRLAEEEISYLRSLGLFQEDFLSFLSTFSLTAEHVKISTQDGELAISIEGPWLNTILWEVPLLAVVNELHFTRLAAPLGGNAALYEEGKRRLHAKLQTVRDSGLPLLFAEFGTRRRHDRAWHDILSKELTEHARPFYVGTSNVMLAMRHRVAAIGTMAHEYLQACQALAPTLESSQRFALTTWTKEYGPKLDVALSDVFGFDAFLADFTPEIAAHYTGTRQDSGDPFEWGEKQVADWRRKGVDPTTKTGLFSDGLDFEKSLALLRRFGAEIRVLVAIGTHLTNDLGPKALNIVIKMVELNGKPVAKISDEPSKSMCEDQKYMAKLRRMIDAKVAAWRAGESIAK